MQGIPLGSIRQHLAQPECECHPFFKTTGICVVSGVFCDGAILEAPQIKEDPFLMQGKIVAYLRIA